MADNGRSVEPASSTTCKGKKRALRSAQQERAGDKRIKTMSPSSSSASDESEDVLGLSESCSSLGDAPLGSSDDGGECALKNSMDSLEVEGYTVSNDEEMTGKGEHGGEPLKQCPTVDGKEKHFRLLDLPPEIRIEIYRACLTRPFDILLSKVPPPPQEKAGEEHEHDHEGEWHAAEQHAHAEVAVASASGSAAPDSDFDPSRSSVHAPSRRLHMSHTIRSWASRDSRRYRNVGAHRSGGNPTIFTPSQVSMAAHHSASHPSAPANTSGMVLRSQTSARPNVLPPARTPASREAAPRRDPRPQDVDPLLVALLQASKLIYKESRPILYGENSFVLDLETALPTLAALHQRSRGQIRTLRLTIPTHNEILERFAEVVRLSLRYCWRLQKFVINMPFVLPGADGSGTSGNTTVYANAFDILRWLPKQCEVVLEGNVCEEIRAVVQRNANLAKSLDELAYARRQLISNDAERMPPLELN